MADNATALLQRRRRRRRQDETDLAAHAASPFDLGETAESGTSDETLVMPANARLAVRCDSALTAGDVSLVAGGSTFELPDLDADQVHRLDYIEEGKSVSLSRAATAVTGTIEVGYVDSFGRFVAIATSDLV